MELRVQGEKEIIKFLTVKENLVHAFLKKLVIVVGSLYKKEHNDLCLLVFMSCVILSPEGKPEPNDLLLTKSTHTAKGMGCSFQD